MEDVQLHSKRVGNILDFIASVQSGAAAEISNFTSMVEGADDKANERIGTMAKEVVQYDCKFPYSSALVQYDCKFPYSFALVKYDCKFPYSFDLVQYDCEFPYSFALVQYDCKGRCCLGRL